MIEPVPLGDSTDLADLAEDFLKYVLQAVLNERSDEGPFCSAESKKMPSLG